MRNLVVFFLLVGSLLGQTAGNDNQTTPVAGESWLSHLHRNLEDTSMGKTGRLGPPNLIRAGEVFAGQPSDDSLRQHVSLHGSDLYRLNCWGCHGEFGLGAPPEINSVINPTRATSVALTLDRMKKLGMEMSRADAATLANQSKAVLLQRLHKGGTDMPSFPHLQEPEIRAIFAYLNQLAGVPGAERQQATVEESPVRVGEHIVKSTCHICHNAAGPNPSPQQLLGGAIPPLNTLTTRTSLSEFERKIKSGAPIMMGMPPAPYRGRMPVFYYFSENEVADAYLYLKRYPPYEWAVLNPAGPSPASSQGGSNAVIETSNSEPAKTLASGNGNDLKILNVGVVAEILVALMLIGGMAYTVREIRRLTAISRRRKVLVMSGSVAVPPTESDFNRRRSRQEEKPYEVALADNAEATPAVIYSQVSAVDHHKYESSWLARRFKNEDSVA